MDLSKTALLLIGFQNDYFAADGILNSVIEESSRVSGVLQNTLELLASAADEFGLVVATPIHFTSDYRELSEPVGILKAIKEMGAFRYGSKGAATIDAFRPYADRILELPGKRGLNAFSNTELEQVMQAHGIENVLLAGTVTSICIDSTGRDAADRGFRVHVLRDCTSGRTIFEQNFYCDQVFPLYATVTDSTAVLAAIA